jgi:hypothetical protein
MNKTTVISILLLSILWIVSCSEEKNPVTTGSDPVISKVNMKDKWSTQSVSFYKTEVWVDDPQGPGNLSGVSLSVLESSGGNEIFSASLYDDGAHFFPQDGDILAGDGVYSNRFPATDISRNSDQTEFVFRFIALNKQNHESQIWENIVVFSPNSAPVIHQIFALDSLSYLTENPIFSIVVSDSDGIGDIAKAYFESENLTKGFTQYEQQLYNDGDFESSGDLIANDSIFSTRISTDFLIAKKGPYNLKFYVEDTSEEQNVDEAVQFIVIENFASQFLNFNIPESIIIPQEIGAYNRELMTVEAVDPEGLADIDSVYFYSMKPDSTLANNGQPFIMVDNGLPYNANNPLIETGDEVYGDGIYTLSLLVYDGTDSGTYTFSLFIRDRAGNLSGPIKKTIQLSD